MKVGKLDKQMKHLSVGIHYDNPIETTWIGKLLNLDFSFALAGDFISGYFFQMINELFLYNGEDCMFWVFDGITDLINAYLLLTEEEKPLSALYSIFFALHKLPIAYNLCFIIEDDFELFIHTYETFTSMPAKEWGPEFVHIGQNIFFNWVDIMYEWIILESVLDEKVWTLAGEYLAKITSDIMFKSPATKSWNYKNSDVLNSDWGEPLPFWEGIIHEINEILVFYGDAPLDEKWTGVTPLPADEYKPPIPKAEPKVQSSRPGSVLVRAPRQAYRFKIMSKLD